MNDGDDARARLATAATRLAAGGIRRVESYAWRDLDDPEAGGSELHADEIFTRWAAAGIEIDHRTSTHDAPRRFMRNGYGVTQRGGRYDVFARVAARQLVRRRPPDTATIEIWNGVPWFGPIWAPHRRVVWMHHVHREMWRDALPNPLDRAGVWLETVLAPRCYRRSTFATLSESSAEEIRAIGIPGDHLTVIPPGVDEAYTPAPARRARVPTVVIVGRLAPVKRQRAALHALMEVRRAHPELRVELIGDGPDRAAIEEWVEAHDARTWVRVRGRVADEELLDAYRRAWLVVSASYAEGWGMSLTEAGACGTPCVATDIAGHRGAAIDGVSGLLVESPEAIAPAAIELLGDRARRDALGRGAVGHAAGLSWTAVAALHLELLVSTCTSASG